MFCGNCGARINDSANFCAFCGERVAQYRVVDKTLLVLQAPPSSAAANQDKARKTATAALILGIVSIVLSLIFAPFIYSIFSDMSVSMSGEDWLWTFVTVFLWLVLKMIGAMFEAMASASLFILPCMVLHVTGLVMAIVSRIKYKEKKRSKTAMLVNVGAILLQIIILVICVGQNPIHLD